MNLAQGNEWHLLSASGAQQPAAISHDDFARIPIGESEVEGTLAIDEALAAFACAKTVNQPGNLG